MASWDEVHLEPRPPPQLRVHSPALRHPGAGYLPSGAAPPLAADLGLTRQWLHARRLGFSHPRTGEWVEYVSQYPADLQFALDSLSSGHA